MRESQLNSADTSHGGREPTDAADAAVLVDEVEALEREIRQLRARNALLHLAGARRLEQLVVAPPDREAQAPVRDSLWSSVAPVRDSHEKAEAPIQQAAPQQVAVPESQASEEPHPLPWLERPPRPKRKWENYVRYTPPPAPAFLADVATPAGELPSAGSEGSPSAFGKAEPPD